jgi:group I intron endonuclease
MLRHKSELKSHKHCNLKLQRAWDKYGESAFYFAVVENVENKKDLIQREQYWIDKLDVVRSGYNISPTAGSLLGLSKSRASVEKTASAHRGMKRSKETCEKIKLARKNQPPMSLEGRLRISESLKNRVISEETRKKLSAPRGKASADAVEKNRISHLGQKNSAESYAKGAEKRRGFKHTEETKNKMSAWQIGRKMSPDSIAKCVATRRAGAGYSPSIETRKKISDALAGKNKSEQMKSRLSKSIKGKRPSNACIEASRQALLGKKFSKETIAKRVATRAKNKASTLVCGQAFAE